MMPKLQTIACALAACASLAACDRQPHSQYTIPPALDTLTTVTLGTTAEQLEHSRPDASFAKYLGYVEHTQATTIAYYFRSDAVRDDHVNTDALVEAIVATYALNPDIEASAAFGAEVRSTALQLGEPNTCFLRDSTSTRATWKLGADRYEVQLHHDPQADSTRIAIVLTARPERPELGSDSLVACSSLPGR
jgi:hypothetical protein